MIARDSQSYPYLAIAQHYNIPYSEILKYADTITKRTKPPFLDWKLEIWCLEHSKK